MAELGRTMTTDQKGRTVSNSTRNITNVKIVLYSRWTVRYKTETITQEQGAYWTQGNRSRYLGDPEGQSESESESGEVCCFKLPHTRMPPHPSLFAVSPQDAGETSPLDLTPDDPRYFYWCSYDDLDFAGGDIRHVYITVDTLGVAEMRLTEFIERYKCSLGGADYMTSSIKYFNRNLIEKRADFYQFEGYEEEKHNSMQVRFDVFGRFEPSKLRFDVDQVWHGIQQRINYISNGCVSYDNAPPSNERGCTYWDCQSGAGIDKEFKTLECTADWQFAAAEAIVRWCKCVLAKRRCVELRRAEKKRLREKASRDKFEASAEKRRKKFEATKLGQSLC